MNQLVAAVAKPWLNARVNSIVVDNGLNQGQQSFISAANPGPGLVLATVFPLGATIAITQAAGAQTITLPAPSAANIGLAYNFRLLVAAGGSTAISSGAANQAGIIIRVAANANLPVTAGTTLTFAATAVVGDSAYFVSDGVHWDVLAYTSSAGGAGVATS